MRLIRPPFEPRSDLYSLFTPYLADERNEAWRTTCSSAGTDGRPWPWTDHADRNPRRRDWSGSGRPVTPATSWADPCATSCSAASRRTGTSPPTRGRTAPRAFPRGGLREPVRDGRRAAGGDESSRSRRSGRITSTPTSAAARVEFGDTSRRPRAAGLHGERARVGRGRAATSGTGRARGARPDRSPWRDRGHRAAPPPGRRGPEARFEEDALRMVRAVRLAATLDFDDRAGDPGRHSRPSAPGRPSVRRARRGGTGPGSSPRSGHRSACGSWPRPGLLAVSSPSWPRGAGGGPEQDRRRGPVGPHAARGRRGAAGPADGPARGPAPRHRQAGHRRPRGTSSTTRSSAPKWPATARSAPRAAGRAAAGRHLVRKHMFIYERAGATPASSLHPPDRAATRWRSCSSFARADNVGSGLPRETPASWNCAAAWRSS